MATNKEARQKLKEQYVGKVFNSNSFGQCEVLDYIDSSNVLIRFLNTGYETLVASGNLRNGLVKDCLARNVAGIGYLGVGKYECRVKGRVTKNRAGCRTLEYTYWESLMKRVYNHKTDMDVRNYGDVSVCEEWHNFQNFAEWCQTQVGFRSGFHLDKDLLVRGNRTYSPDTCCFIPCHLNSAITGMKHTNTSGATGVWVTPTDKFVSEITLNSVKISLGTYDTLEKASLIYKNIKKAYINSLAEVYKDSIGKEAYLAALAWSVEND